MCYLTFYIRLNRKRHVLNWDVVIADRYKCGISNFGIQVADAQVGKHKGL